MKLFLFGLLVTFGGAAFVDFLQGLQHHNSFQHLSSSDKLLFGELVLAAEQDELSAFLDRVGLVDVLKLMDHMSHYDAERFAAYLAEHTNYTHHAPDHGDVINRRRREHDQDHDHHGSLYTFLRNMHTTYYKTLPQLEQATLVDLLHASQNHAVTGYIDTNGYGRIFGLLEHLDSDHAIEVSRLIENALAAEAAAAARQRRKDNDDNQHHHNFDPSHASSQLWQYLQSLNTQYYEHLPEQERQTYHQLVEAAKNHDVTGFVNTVGYGAIFGFLEHLDYVHSNQVYDYITKALEREAQAATRQRRKDNDDNQHHHYDPSHASSQLWQYLQSLSTQYYEHLPEPERQTYHQLVEAARNHDVTGFVNTVGYGAIFGFLEHLDYVHSNQVYDYITKALEREAQAAARQ